MEHTTSTTTRPRPHAAGAYGGVPRPAGPAAGARGTSRRPHRPGLRARGRAGRRGSAAGTLARLPAPRLTGLGCGVLAVGVMAATGGLARLVDGAPVLYGVVFLLTAAAAAAWVRPGDLICAPVAVPLAYAVGLGISGGLFGVLTELAMGAPWLFAGTALATAVVLVRQALIVIDRLRRRAAARRRQAA